MAVGEAAAPLQQVLRHSFLFSSSLSRILLDSLSSTETVLFQATQLLSLDFALWHVPTVTLEELLERTVGFSLPFSMMTGFFLKALSHSIPSE